MKVNVKLLRPLVLLLLFSLSLAPLTGCRRQVVEKIGVLPDRPTQFIAHNTEAETNLPEGKSWNVQNVTELQLFTAEIDVTETPSVHYYENTAYLHRTLKQDSAQTLHSFEQLDPTGALDPIYSMVISEGSDCSYAPSGTIAAYSTWIDGCLTLILVDLISNEQHVLWQSDEASLLKELNLSVKLHCQWSSDGSTLLFLPICFEESVIPTTDSDSQATTEITTAEKMQLVYEALPNFPIIYIYQLESKQLQSFLIAAEDYPLYDETTAPMVCATDDGSQFFIYFNSPSDSALAHYIDVNHTLHYSTPLSSYLPSFTQLGSEPMFYHSLLYLHVDNVGIMIFDPEEGSLIAQYPFNDPIHSFTIYEDALIVAQPSGIGSGGVDVTAYLLNQENRQSVLLYHNNDTYSPFINHMEMSQNGQYLLIEQLPSEYRNQKQLIQLSFN